MILTEENYFSVEAKQEYCSASQFKTFCGTPMKPPCEARAMAEMKGEYRQSDTTELLIGGYVDAYFSDRTDAFRAKKPYFFKLDGEIQGKYNPKNVIGKMIKKAEGDKYFMNTLKGERQKIFTGELFGLKWKAMVDFYQPDAAIVDLKAVRSIRTPLWGYWRGKNQKIPFFIGWGYEIQGALYTALEQKATGREEPLPFFIAALSKEDPPDIAVIGFRSVLFTEALAFIEECAERIKMVKAGEVEPVRCEICEYCRKTKVLKTFLWDDELGLAL